MPLSYKQEKKKKGLILVKYFDIYLKHTNKLLTTNSNYEGNM